MKWTACLALAWLLTGCGATHQVKFDPWRGFAPETTEALKRGDLDFPKDKVFRAAGDVLDHEPFLRWEFEQLDSKEGWIKATAGQFRLMNMRVTDASGDSATAKSRISISLPKRTLDGQKDVWVSDEDTRKMTAYDLEFSRRKNWHSVTANFELDQDYLVSAIYRQLTDLSAVPFSLEELDNKKALPEAAK